MKKKNIVLIVAILLLVLVLVFSAWKVVSIFMEYMKGVKVYSEMDDYVSMPAQPPLPTNAALEEEAQPEQTEPAKSPFPEVDFDALWAQNSDVVAWIYIPDTNVNYPILQGYDNEQYLYHMINGECNSAGSIFLEAGLPNDFSSKNNPIYGHRMKNGTMFADIVKYTTQKFYEEHAVGYLITPDSNYVLHMFSGYVTDTGADAWDTSFSEAGFEKWLKNVGRKSYFSSEVVPTTEDHILTFSTCTYEREDGRFVVHAVMEEYIV